MLLPQAVPGYSRRASARWGLTFAPSGLAEEQVSEGWVAVLKMSTPEKAWGAAFGWRTVQSWALLLGARRVLLHPANRPPNRNQRRHSAARTHPPGRCRPHRAFRVGRPGLLPSRSRPPPIFPELRALLAKMTAPSTHRRRHLKVPRSGTAVKAPAFRPGK
jgi:hypothetical protein